MRKKLTALVLPFLLICSVFAEEKRVHKTEIKYKFAPRVHLTTAAIGLGVLSLGTGAVYYSHGKFKVKLADDFFRGYNSLLQLAVPNRINQFVEGVRLMNTGATLALSGGLLAFLSATQQTINVRKDKYRLVDQENTVANFKKIKSLINSYKFTSVLPTSASYTNILNQYTCVECRTDKDKALQIANLLQQTEDLAKNFVSEQRVKFISKEDFNHFTKDSKEMVRASDLVGVGRSGYNDRLAMQLFHLAIVNELYNAKK